MPATVLIAPREAGIGLRLVALLLDVGIVVIIFAALNVVLAKSGVLPAPKLSQLSPLLSIWQHAGSWIAFATALCVLVILAWSFARGTPGALLMGVNVVRARDGRRAGIVRCVWRLGVCLGLAGLGFVGAWRGKRALHDRISGTRVIHEDESTYSVAHYAGQNRWVRQ